MKTQFVAAIAALVGIGVGSIVANALHAQPKPPVYFIGDNDVSDPEAYAKEYLPRAQALIKAGGGRYLAAGKAVSFDGPPPNDRVIIIVWDSMEQLQAWFNSPDYRAARKIGDQYAKFHTFAIQGTQ
jgi:uncharacterized protein (DUF1330 family)